MYNILNILYYVSNDYKLLKKTIHCNISNSEKNMKPQKIKLNNILILYYMYVRIDSIKTCSLLDNIYFQCEKDPESYWMKEVVQ